MSQLRLFDQGFLRNNKSIGNIDSASDDNNNTPVGADQLDFAVAIEIGTMRRFKFDVRLSMFFLPPPRARVSSVQNKCRSTVRHNLFVVMPSGANHNNREIRI